MKRALLPYLRTAKLLKLRYQTRIRCVMPMRREQRLPVRFIVGCGRSGTTILGRVLSVNPSVHYLREPYHLWHAIDPRTDSTGLHSQDAPPQIILRGSDADDRAKDRFQRLIASSGRSGAHSCVIEKTPQNALRVEWLEQLEPQPRFVHIVRDGNDVVRSITRLAETPTYRLAFRSAYNQWWGEHGRKWKSIARSGREHGYFVDLVDSLQTNEHRAAYEWLISVMEIERFREHLGDRLLEVTYRELTSDPASVLRSISDHFEFRADDQWLNKACAQISEERKYERKPLSLPNEMALKFNELQERYGNEGRAVPAELNPSEAV